MYTIHCDFDKIMNFIFYFFNTSMWHNIIFGLPIPYSNNISLWRQICRRVYGSVLWIIILVGGHLMSPIREIKTRSQPRLAKWIPVSINHSPGVRIATTRPFPLPPRRPEIPFSLRRWNAIPYLQHILFHSAATAVFIYWSRNRKPVVRI